MNDGQRFLAVVSAVFLAVFAAICFVDGQFIYGTMFLAAAVVMLAVVGIGPQP
jgi:uncharacterized membrane protein